MRHKYSALINLVLVIALLVPMRATRGSALPIVEAPPPPVAPTPSPQESESTLPEDFEHLPPSPVITNPGPRDQDPGYETPPVRSVGANPELEPGLLEIRASSMDYPPSEPITHTNQTYKEYNDPFWAFSIKIPEPWIENNNPYIGLGYNFSSPDLELDPIGLPLVGAYLTVNVQPLSEWDWELYKANTYMHLYLLSEEQFQNQNISRFRVSAVSGKGDRFEDLILITADHIFRFSLVISKQSQNEYFSLAEPLLTSVTITGLPVSYPKSNSQILDLDLATFDFTPIKLPFMVGPGRIISGYWHQNPPNQYAFDLCEGGGCSASTTGQYVVAPSDMKYDWSLDSDGNGSLDFHFFELANDGANKLCTQMGHFRLEIPGLTGSVEIPRSAALGRIVEYSPSIEHIHMGLYTIPSSYRCAGDPSKRVGVSYNDPYTLEGVNYPINENHYGKSVSSTQAPFCWQPLNPQSPLSSESLNTPIDDPGCFPNYEDIIPPSGYFTSPSNGATITSQTVTISVNANDNSGGSGIREVRFSAVWPGSSWIGIGTDSTYPYSIDWDMCSYGVPNGDIELGMEVWDNAGNVFIWSRDGGANPHITKDFTCTDPNDVYWNTQAWMNKYLAGYVNWEGWYIWGNGYPYIYLNWGNGAPFDGWGSDEFSMRIWRSVYFPGGHYDFYTRSDDGHKLFIDGNMVIDRWWDGGDNTGAHGMDLSSGNHEVKVEYYENQGDAKLEVWWYGPGYPRPDVDPPTGRITSPVHLSATNTSPLGVSVEANDDVSGVNRVELYAWYCYLDVCDWRYLGTDSTGPYSFQWDWLSLPDMHVWLSADIFDNSGKATYSAGGWVEVDLDRSLPTVIIDSPVDDAYINTNQIPIQAIASDVGSGLYGLQFIAGYDDGSGEYWHEIGWDIDDSDGWQLVWDASSVSDQTGVAVFIYAYDWAWNYQGTARWDMTLDRTPPSTTFDISQPYGDAPFRDFYPMWSGTDGLSGIASYDVQYRDGPSGEWTDLLTDTIITFYHYIGEDGHTYYFRARAQDNAGNESSYAGGDGDAQHTVTICPTPPDNFESDDSFAEANWTTTDGITQTHTIHAEGDQDWAVFGATAGITYTLATTNTGGHADTQLYLYDTDGSTLLDFNDDYPGMNYASRIDWQPITSGDYYVKVDHWDPWAFGCTTEYGLSVSSIDDLLFADGFESGNLIAWSSSIIDGGDLSVSPAAALVGSYGLQALIDDNNSLVVSDLTPNAEPRYRVRFYFDPNTITMASGDSLYLLYAYAGSSSAVLRLEFRSYNSSYQLRASQITDGSTWRATGWSNIADSPHFIELDWRAASAAGANDGGLTFWIDGVQQANLTGTDNDTRRIDKVQLGFTGIDSGTRGTAFLDAFESRKLNYIGPAAVFADFSAAPTWGSAPLQVSFTDLSLSPTPITGYLWDFGDGDTSTEANPVHIYTADGTYTVSLTATSGSDQSTSTKVDLITVTDLIFADGFEPGNLIAWSSSIIDGGDLSVSPAAALVGSYGLQALIDDNNSLVVSDLTPNAEPRYRVRFYFDPNTITMASGDSLYLLYAYAGSSSAVLRLELRSYNSSYQLRASQITDGSTWRATGWSNIADSPHFIELDWRAASAAGTNDGGLTFWIDGVQQANLTGTDNDTRRIDKVQLGFTGIDSGTRGTAFLDAFESRKLNYIGP